MSTGPSNPQWFKSSYSSGSQEGVELAFLTTRYSPRQGLSKPTIKFPVDVGNGRASSTRWAASLRISKN